MDLENITMDRVVIALCWFAFGFCFRAWLEGYIDSRIASRKGNKMPESKSLDVDAAGKAGEISGPVAPENVANNISEGQTMEHEKRPVAEMIKKSYRLLGELINKAPEYSSVLLSSERAMLEQVQGYLTMIDEEVMKSYPPDEPNVALWIVDTTQKIEHFEGALQAHIDLTATDIACLEERTKGRFETMAGLLERGSRAVDNLERALTVKIGQNFAAIDGLALEWGTAQVKSRLQELERIQGELLEGKRSLGNANQLLDGRLCELEEKAGNHARRMDAMAEDITVLEGGDTVQELAGVLDAYRIRLERLEEIANAREKNQTKT